MRKGSTYLESVPTPAARNPRAVPRGLGGPQARRAHTTLRIREHAPELALLGIVLATASFWIEDRLPVLYVGVGIHIPDFLLLGLLGCIAVGWLIVPTFRIVRTPLDLPLLVFYGVTFFSTVNAVVHSKVQDYDAVSTTRVFSYYLTFFAVTNLVKSHRQVNFLLNGVLLLATLVAVAMIAQYLLGDSVQLFTQVGALDAPTGTFEASRRVAPPGFSIVLVSFITSLCILAVERVHPRGLLRGLQCGVLGVALLVTFFRSYWAALVIVICLLAVLVRGPDKRRLVGWGLSGLVAIATVALVMYVASVGASESRASRLLDATWERYSTLMNGGTFRGEDPSVTFRKLESGYALSAIASNPVIGLGMGTPYRPWDPRLDWRDAGGIHDLRSLIHNSHLLVLLQSGVVGYVSLLWLSVAFLARGFRNWHNVPDERLKAVVLAFALVFVALLIAATANSTLMQSYWTPVIGIIMGINEAILRLRRPSEAVA